MRIFYAAQNTPNEFDLPDSKLWHANLYLSLEEMGHELLPFSHPWLPEGYKIDMKTTVQSAAVRNNRADFSQRLLEAVRSAHRKKAIQVFFSYLTSAHVEPEAIRQIGALGITTLNWYCNASYQFHNVAEIAPAYHHCLVPEKFRIADYRRVGANPIYCQEAANPRIYLPYDVPIEFDVTFVGQKYGNRPHFLRQLVDGGIDLRVWGPNWIPTHPKPWWLRGAAVLVRSLPGRVGLKPPGLPAERCGPPLSDEELIRMYSRSKISLGFTTVAQIPTDAVTPIKQVRLRDFEATMSGAFYLVEAFDELAEFFEPDREVVFFADAAELVDKTRYYLAHDRERERIRRAGMERSRAEHTWRKRFLKVFRQLGLS